MNVQNEMQKLNPIAQLAIQCFIDAGFDDGYILGKIDQLSNYDKWRTAFWATHQLDEKNKARFADKLGVSIEDLTTTFETIRKMEFIND